MLSDEPVCEAKMVRGSRPFNFTMEEEQEQVKREQTEALGRRAPVLREKKKRRRNGNLFNKLPEKLNRPIVGPPKSPRLSFPNYFCL